MKNILIIFLFIVLKTTCFSQVNLQTGVPQIQIPLLGVSDAFSGLTTSVSLNYVGGNGIKTESIASCVGTGWDIGFGGFVVREQRGEPDDQKQPNTYTYPTAPNAQPFQSWNSSSPEVQDITNYINNYYPNGYLFSEYSPDDFINNNACDVPQLPCGRQQKYQLPPVYLADREIDLFTFSFNGRSGSFWIGKKGNAANYPILMMDEKNNNLKIEPIFDETLLNQNIQTVLKKFKIIDETGVEYYFEEMELDEIIKYTKISEYHMDGTPVAPNGIPYSYMLDGNCFTSNSSSGSPSFIPSTFEASRGVGTGKYICSRWLLSKIKNPLTGKQITFSYELKETNYEGGVRVSQSSMYFNGQDTKSKSILKLYYSTKGRRIINIENQLGEKIHFVYGESRKDLPGDKILETVEFQKDNTTISSYQFSYGYFFKDQIVPLSYTFTTDDNAYARLCLLEFQYKGKDDIAEPPHKFDYYTNNGFGTSIDIVPARFSYYKDHYGYFNNFNNSNLLAEPVASGMYSDVNLQKGVEAYSAQNFKEPFGAVWNGLIKSIQFPAGGKGEYVYEHNRYGSGNSNHNFAGGARVASYTLIENNITINKNEYNYNLQSPNQDYSSMWGHEDPIYSETQKFSSPPCSGNAPIRINLTSALSAFNTPTPPDVRTFSQCPAQGYGSVRLMTFAYSLFEQVLYNLFIYWGNSQGQVYPINQDVQVVSSEPFNYVNSLPLYYSQVEAKTLNAVGATLKRDVFEFTSPSDFNIEIPTNQFQHPYPLSTRYLPQFYGLEKKITTYDGSNVVSVKENIYNINKSTVANSLFASKKWKQKGVGHVCGINIYYSSSTSDNFISSSSLYYPLTGKVLLTQTKEYVYNQTGDNVLTSKQFEYNSDNFCTSIKQFDSRGRKIESINRYVKDYTLSGVITTMKDKNMIGIPVATETYLYKSPTDKYLLSGSTTEYGVIGNNDIKPIKTYLFVSPSAVNNNLITPFSSGQLIRDNNYYKLSGEVVYDNEGRPSQTNKIFMNGSTPNITDKGANIYDDNNQGAVIATAINASRSDIAYTSFDAPAGAQNFTYTQSLVTGENWMTGSKSLKMDQSVRTISIGSLNTAIKYKVTFWAKNVASNNYSLYVNKNNETVSGGYFANSITPMKVYTNSVTGWSLYECSVTGATSIAINNQNSTSPATGNSMFVEEVRLFPEGASMSTATYDIRGLKTTTIDANNKIQYTEYDGLGRVRLIRDENRNVIKTYEYNFKN